MLLIILRAEYRFKKLKTQGPMSQINITKAGKHILFLSEHDPVVLLPPSIGDADQVMFKNFTIPKVQKSSVTSAA